jgi:hypothetical protein
MTHERRSPVSASEDLTRRLTELQQEVGRLRSETSWVSRTALNAARILRVSAKGRWEAEAQAGWDRLAPPVGLVRWHPRQAPADTPDVAQGLIDRLRAGDPVADSLGNVAVAEPKASPTRASALSLSCEPNPFRTRTAISLQLTANS